MTVYAYQDTKGRFLQCLALLMAVHNPCQRREMTVSTNNGLVNGQVGTQPAYAVFHPGQLKNRSFRNLFFFDIVTTQNDISSYAKHVLGRIYVFFTSFGC